MTSQVFRDVGSWYHIVAVQAEPDATSTDRVRLYVNGSRLTDFTTETYSAGSAGSYISNAWTHRIGSLPYSVSSLFDGYLAEIYLIDGQSLDSSNFGETNADTNQWIAKKYAGSYGTNGFYLKFQDSSALGDDSSGNTNDFTVTNLVATDQVLDSPTNNFCTLNPLDAAGRDNTFSEGNLKCVVAAQNTNEETRSTIGVSSGKWYWEFYLVSTTTTAGYFKVGLKSPDGSNYWNVRGSDGELDHDGSTGTSSVSYTTTNIVNVAVDMDSGKWWVGTNGTWVGDPSAGSGELHSGISGTVLPYILNAGSGGTHTIVSNFGQDSSFAGNKTAQGNGGTGEDFYYTPPTGYKALNTNNLNDPSIDDPTAYFNTILWAGDSTSPRSFSGVGFSPDLVWNKSRSSSSWWNIIFDRIRGGGQLVTSQNDAELIQGSNLGGYVSSYDTDGFTATAGAISNGSFNNSGDTYVAWNWKAGGTAVSNTDGSITSSVSANTTAGFSIVSYTGNSTAGATVGHGLSQAPEMLIVKQRDAVKNWSVLAIDPTDYLMLNSSNASADDIGFWNDTNPSSSVFTLGSIDWVNNNTSTYIAYCFHSVDGYSKVGSYVGNDQNPEGPFIYTGFQPSFLMIKAIDRGDDWIIVDNKRDSYNILTRKLNPNTNGAEITNHAIVDFVSNGFKIRDNSDKVNLLNSNYLYLAFAESPFKYSNAR